MNAELEQLAAYKKSFPTCDRHAPSGGTRAGCLICALEKLSAALSRIDYACGEPNDMQVSGYDVHCNEDAVVEQVEKMVKRLAAVRPTTPESLPRFLQILDGAIAEERKNSLDDTAYGADLRAVMRENVQVLEECVEWIRVMANIQAQTRHD
jgi:hypothetical protein